jgi:hypothetical protein
LLKGALHEALNIIDADPDFDISQFNSDYDEGDTYIDAISFLHSGYGAEFSGTDCYGTGRGGRIWRYVMMYIIFVLPYFLTLIF